MRNRMIPCSSIVSSPRYTFQANLIVLIDSGHGGQEKDTDGDEADGYDECKPKIGYMHLLSTDIIVIGLGIYPVDHESVGSLVDDVSRYSLVPTVRTLI